MSRNSNMLTRPHSSLGFPWGTVFAAWWVSFGWGKEHFCFVVTWLGMATTISLRSVGRLPEPWLWVLCCSVLSPIKGASLVRAYRASRNSLPWSLFTRPLTILLIAAGSSKWKIYLVLLSQRKGSSPARYYFTNYLRNFCTFYFFKQRWELFESP